MQPADSHAWCEVDRGCAVETRRDCGTIVLMRVLEGLAQAALGLAGLWSMITFTLVMLGEGSFGWLLLGWFALPITAVVWPAILGAWWVWLFYVIVAVGLIVSAVVESKSSRQVEEGEDAELPGGFAPGVLRPGLLYSSDPLPPSIHEENQIAKGTCAFKEPSLMFSEGPSGSPPLGFKMTRNAIWTLNPDGTLYSRVDWDQLEKLVVRTDGDETRWLLRGSYLGHEFRILDVVPSPSTAQAFLDLLREKGIEADTRTARPEGPDLSPR